MADSLIGASKLGHPQPESYLLSELNSGASQHVQWYSPVSLLWSNVPVKGASVPCCRHTRYCSSVRVSRQYSSGWLYFCFPQSSPLHPLFYCLHFNQRTLNTCNKLGCSTLLSITHSSVSNMLTHLVLKVKYIKQIITESRPKFKKTSFNTEC